MLLAQGQIDAARAALASAQEAQSRWPIVSVLHALLHSIQVRLWLAQGNLDAAGQWVEASVAGTAGTPENRGLDQITRARVRLAQHREQEALRVLSEVAQAAEASGRMTSLIETRVLQALAWQALGDPGQARSALEDALARGEPEGFVRVFLDEGDPMSRLLERIKDQGMGHIEYTRRLVALYEAGQHPPPLSLPPPPLVEPLSEREIQVLRCLAEGLAYPEIARQLVIARGTVKAHVHNIYGKLSVPNRTQAIARARELRLL